MPNIRNSKVPVFALELCWWEQTRLLMEEIFRKPRLIGTFPFTNGYNIALWPSIALVAAVISLSLLSISFIPKMELKGNYINVVMVWILRGIIATLYNILSPLWMVYNHKCLIKCLRLISSVVKKLDKATQTCKRKLISFFLFPAIGTTITVAHCIFLYHTDGIISAFSLIIVVICTCPTMSYVWQYLTLHDVLRSLMIRISNLRDVDDFVNCYHSLVLAYRSMNKLYGLQIMIYFVMAMRSVLHSLYFTFTNEEFDTMTTFQILWASFSSAMVLLIIRRCNASVAQSKMVNEQLYKRMVYEDNNNLIHDKLLAFHLSSCRKLVFTACGFFNLDNSLICSMVACATTYLVIMLQFTLPTNLQANNQSFAHF
ncbi:Gustatory receptor 120d [Halyomorpha halys]|nr:Gustatory receptor 120d [Halyomorpha halys]